MKNKLLLLALFVSLAIGASAQIKIGYIRIDDVVGLMPEVKAVNIDTVGQKYVQDSIVPRFEYVNSEYQKKIVEFGDTTKAKIIRDQILSDAQKLKDELDNAQPIVQQILQAKKQAFLQPYYLKAQETINKVAKEKGYTHVFASDVFIVAPETDNLIFPVLAKLGIKVPEQPKQ